MLKVPFYQLKDATSQLVGWITLENAALACDPADNPSLNSALRKPAWDGKQIIYPDKDPETWMKLLSSTFRGTYFWAGDVQQS